MKSSRQAGISLIELVVVVALLLLSATWLIPNLRAYTVEAHILGAGRQFKAQFHNTRMHAIKSGAYAAIRFEDCAYGPCFSIYRDRDHDGVRADDIARGIDLRVEGPLPLTAGAPGVRVGINPGVPAIPPESGRLAAGSDPIKFGRSRMVSFSPFGSASPGTFYLAGRGVQGAVRVTGGSARVRLMVWRGGRTWVER
jgi:type II secretory pathway pseudopilin PulG